MAAGYGAGQYDDAYDPQRLQNWNVPRSCRKRPSPGVRSTTIIADDRGHLLPTVPRSQVSPWGTFVGTWEMPTRIPPARVDLTSRSATAATRLLERIQQPTVLTHACNGLRTHITGRRKVSQNQGCPDGEGGVPTAPQNPPWQQRLVPGAELQEPLSDAETTKEPSRGSSRASNEDIGCPPTPHPAPTEAAEPRGSIPSREGSRGQAGSPVFGKTPEGEEWDEPE